jgi:acyl dehydratase
MITQAYDAMKLGDRTVSRARTVTETDVVMFAALSGDWYPLHSDQEYASATSFGQRIAHGLLVLSITSGLLKIEPECVIAFYGMDQVRFTAPTFIQDTIHVETEVVDLEDRSERAGLVTFKILTKKSSGETVLTCLMKVLVAKAALTG